MDAAKALKHSRTKSFIELNEGLRTAAKDATAARSTVNHFAGGALGATAAIAASKTFREKTASDNKYLEKVAGLLTPIGKVKGLATAASRGGVKGSMFGKTTTVKPFIITNKPSL